MVFSKIKLYAGTAVAAVIAFLGAMLSIRTSQRDKAVAETETAETNLTKAVEANETHQKVEEVNHAVQEAKDSIRDTSINDRRERLRQQARDYHGDES